MCGIAGAINFKPNRDIVFSTLNHRGPDENGFYEDLNLSLFHTRLSIQDVKCGQQPFIFNDYAIVFNGEIYNHLELRDKLSDFTFKTNSDTETLLYLYLKYKEKAFEKIDGMFAFAIYDKSNKRLILARDRAGKKPLYFYSKENQFFFASELNAINKAVDGLKISKDAIASYLRVGFFYKGFTPYQDVAELEAGTVLTVELESMKESTNRYFDISEYYNSPKNVGFDESVEKTDDLLRKSITDRLISSDLEVGAFLSGGIDSSLIVAIASEYQDKLKTFTVKFDGAYDESSLARLTAEKYHTEHHEIKISMNLRDDVEKIILNYGMPFMDSSAIPSYYVSREARKYVTVALNGDGADELFGGYRRYVPAANNLFGLAKKFSFLSKLIPPVNNKKSIISHLKRLFSMSKKTGLDFYLSSTYDVFEDFYVFPQNKIFSEMSDYLIGIENLGISKFSEMLLADFNLLLFSDLLVKMDIATMANSLEVRSPFLSKYLLEFAPTIKDEYKIKGKTTKYILRELAKKYLSPELLNQPKRGFEVPLKGWVNGVLKEQIFAKLECNSFSSDFIEQKFITSLLADKVKLSAEKRAKMLWNMYCLEVWKNNQ